MSNNDIAVGPVSLLTGSAAISKKPSYLIYWDEPSQKNKQTKKFITLDKPELLEGFVQVKGFFTELPDEEIIKNLYELLTTTAKDLFLEVLVPWHKISYIRSLAYKQK